MSLSSSRIILVYKLYVLAWTGLDWLFPPYCGGCKKQGTRWCEHCDNSTKRLPKVVCRNCGRAISYSGSCPDCVIKLPTYNEVRSWAYFEGPLREAIHRLKYYGDIGLGEILARKLITILKNLDWQPDIILPVPLSKTRHAERGYNQAALIARPIALAQGLEYSGKSLIKMRETSNQVGLNYSERFINVAGAFSADNRRIFKKKVLIIDDVYTTGATMDACSQALVDAGALKVFGLTLARSYYQSKNELDHQMI